MGFPLVPKLSTGRSISECGAKLLINPNPNNNLKRNHNLIHNPNHNPSLSLPIQCTLAWRINAQQPG